MQDRSGDVSRPGALTSGVAAALVLCLLAPANALACRQWTASGAWVVRQSNNIEVQIEAAQDGELLTGQGRFFGRVVDPTQQDIPNSSGHRWYTGELDATISGNSIEIKIFFMPGIVSYYTGVIDASGQARGKHWHRDHPETRFDWEASPRFTCRP